MAWAALLMLLASAWLGLIERPQLNKQILHAEQETKALLASTTSSSSNKNIDNNQIVINSLLTLDTSNAAMENLVNQCAAQEVRVGEIRAQPKIVTAEDGALRTTMIHARFVGSYAKIKSVLAHMQTTFPSLALESLALSKGQAAPDAEADVVWALYWRGASK